MRTLLVEIQQIEKHLLKTAEPQDALLFEAYLILNPALKQNVLWQQKTMQLVKVYSREKLKAEINAISQQLFTQPAHKSFRQKIRRIFLRP